MAQLRQNPAPMIQDVRRGEQYTLTDRSLPVADILPHHDYWRPAHEVFGTVRHTQADPDWAAELDELREEEWMSDPWAE